MATSIPRPPRHALAAPDNAPPLDAAVRAIELIDAHGLCVAPHVAARLDRDLAGDEVAILQLAEWMSDAQRRGGESLPDPLPLLDRVEDAVGDPRLADWEFELLVAAAVCVDDRTEILLEVVRRPIGELIAGAASRHLRLVAGHFAFADPRMRVWVHGSASLAERTTVHARLAEVYTARGDEERALWHRALCTLEGDAELVAPLLTVARAVLATGDAERAHAIAREATSHAMDADARDRAGLLAGVTAAAAGLVDDAVRHLSPVTASTDPRMRIAATGALLAAATWRSGVVPDADLEACLARADSASPTAARACALAAALLAERGEREAAERWAARAAATDPDGAASALARAWTRLHSGAVDAVHGDRSLLGGVADALALGLRGETAAALRRIAQRTGSGAARGDAIRGLELSPVARAYRAVAATLLRFWSGDVRGAHDELLRAATELPVGVPFAGLGVTLARRLELAVAGETGALSRALAGSVPQAAPGDALRDRAIADFLAERVDEASMRVRLHHELHAGSEVLWVPAIDEVGPLDVASEDRDACLPPDAARGCRVRALARSADRAGELEEAAALARTLDSPFERGRAEAAIGSGWAAVGDQAAARRHLALAESLLGEAGADAWRALVARRLDRCAGHGASAAAGVDADAPPVSDGEPWRELLTERELEVALLVVGGASNREIASQLFLSVRTVEVHVGRILAKLGVRSRVELMVLAHRVGVGT